MRKTRCSFVSRTHHVGRFVCKSSFIQIDTYRPQPGARTPREMICTILVKVVQIKFLTKNRKLWIPPPAWGSAALGCAARPEQLIPGVRRPPPPGVQWPVDVLLGLSSLSPGFRNPPPAWGSAACGCAARPEQLIPGVRNLPSQPSTSPGLG